MNPFSRTIINGVLDRGRSLPSRYRLFYSRTPNNWLDVGWETDFGWDSNLSAWSIPRTVTDWTGTERDMFTILGEGLFFDSAGNSLVVSGTQILAWAGINQYHVLYHPARGLAVYDPYSVTDAVIVKADKFMRQPAYSDVPTIFFNGTDITGSSGFDSGVLGTNPGQWVPDYLGNLVNAGVDVPAMQGMRLAGTSWVDTKLDGTPTLPSTLQPTRTFDAGFVTSAPGPTFKRYIRSNPATDMPGYLSEPARTNKVTCRKANPVDTTGLTTYVGSTFSVVDDTAALNSAGLIGVCSSGKVYEMVIPTGGAVVVSGVVSNVNPHSASAFLRKISGNGSVGIGISGSPKAYTSSASYVSVKTENITPVDTTRYFTVVNTNADTHVLRLILPQLEEGPFCTSPICKLQNGSDSLAAITRAGTVLSYPTLGKIRPNNQAYRMVVVPRATGKSGAYIYGTYNDASNYTAVIIDPTAITYRKRIAGVNTDATVSIIHTNNVPIQIAIVGTSSTGMRIAALQFVGGVWSAWNNGTLVDSASGKANCIVGTTYQLGSLNNVGQFTGNISELETLDIPLGITDPLAWAKAQWGLPA